MFVIVMGNDYLCMKQKGNTMIENVIKKYFKGKEYIASGCGFNITYKVNVNIRVIKKVSGRTVKQIDWNVKIVKCSGGYTYNTPNTTGNIFHTCRRSNWMYNDVRMVVREDLNRWFGKIFSTYFYRNISTRLCDGVEIGLNKFTYK